MKIIIDELGVVCTVQLAEILKEMYMAPLGVTITQRQTPLE
jgi:hypothetical protein